MTESRIDVGGPDIDGNFERTPAERFSEQLVRLLGGEAAQATLLATKINTMSGLRRHNAMLALTALIIDLESVADEPKDLRLLVDEQLGRRRMHVVAEELETTETASQPVVEHVEQPESLEPEQADTTDPEPNEAYPRRGAIIGHETDAPASKNARDFAKKLFGDDRAESLTVAQLEALITITESLYLPKNDKKESALRQIERLKLYLDGISATHISEMIGITPTGVNLGRNNILKIIHREYSADELEEAANKLFASEASTPWLTPVPKDEETEQLDNELSIDDAEKDDEELVEQLVELHPSDAEIEELEGAGLETKPDDELIEVALGEQAEGVVYDRADSAPSRVDEILAENGITDDESTKEELSLRDKVLNDVFELWVDRETLIVSYEAMLTEQQVGPASASARQELKDLMEKYAPRWMQKLGIPQHPWQLTRNVLGSERQPISVKEADKLYRGRLALARTTAEDEFLQIVEFLVSKQLANAPAEPKAHHATTGKKSFRKGRAKR